MGVSTKLSAKYQISIPKEVREDQKWRPGQEFVFLPRNGGWMLVPVPERDSLFGIAKGANPEDYRDRNDRF